MTNALRWTIVFAIGLILIGMIAYARGTEHHHGDDVGALSSGVGLVLS